MTGCLKSVYGIFLFISCILAQPCLAQISAPAAPAVQLVGLNVTDVEKSSRFYTEVFGLQELHRYTFPNVVEVVLGYPNQSGAWIVLVRKSDAPAHVQLGNGFSRIGLIVADVAEALRRITRLGLGTAGGSHQGPGAILGHATDPDGYPIELIQSTQPQPR